ncbi:uncharacterized protein [Littorina saxatilis]|uniref:Roc domain-containing protein n=1 Tax=Littorina saxatilis TaxID=31220 RepID=A0AAN9GAZ6_9CAEN
MEEPSQMSTEDDITYPGPLFRVKIMVIGPVESGKSSLVQCLLHNTPHSPTSYSPTEGVNVDLWTPFKTQKLQRLLNRKLTGDEHHLIVELWDTSGRQVCQAVHGLFLTARTLCVIVYDVSDGKAAEKVLALYRMIRQKYVGSTVVIVGNKLDLLQPPAAAQETMAREKLLQVLNQQNESYKQGLAAEMEETKGLLKTSRAKETDNDTQRKGSEDPAEHRLAQQHLTHLEQRFARAIRNPQVRAVAVSALSGKGLDDLRKILLEASLDQASFPYCSSTVRPSTVALYDQILALRERDIVMLPWRHFQEMTKDGGEANKDHSQDDMDYLEAVGALSQFSLGTVTFPTPSQQQQQQHSHQQPIQQHDKKKPVARQKDKASAQGAGEKSLRQEEERYVCVHPATFATLICYCLIDDDKKSFRFEAGRFWPRDSGFKHPDPHMLCKVLEAIPQLGTLRECLLPLLWQEYPLSEDQIQHMLQVVQGLGLLAHHSDQKKHCEGLAMPHFLELSVHRCYTLPLLSLLSDNRPQLNWTAKPFVGDIQITWSFHLHVHAGVLQRLLAAVLFFSRHSSNYRHLWRTGLLLRVGEATVCAEQQLDGQRFDVACRVNGDDLGRETEDVRMLWATLAPFVMHVRRCLLQWPALHFKETLTALGQQFYLDERVEHEPHTWVPAALSLWHRHSGLTFTEADTDHELDVKLVFPFKPDSSVLSEDDWLNFVISQTDVILSDANVTMTSSLPPTGQEKALKRSSIRNSVKHQRKKKSVEVKWKLQEENNNANQPAAITTANNNNDPSNKGDNHTDKGGNQTTAITPISTGNKDKTSVPQGRVVGAAEEQAEAVRLASVFVSAILASAMADFVAQEAEGDQDGRKLVSTAQITAARVTAEAALAVQTGNIEGAATAVIDAVNAVRGNHSAPSKADSKSHGGQYQSKLCVLL